MPAVTSSELESLPRPWGRLTDHIGLGVVSARFDRDLLEEVINRTGRREKRSRRLPAHVMIRYVIAMGLFFSESYDEVMRRLVGNLRRLGSWDDGWQVPTKSAISQARQRLGAAPVKALFERAAVPLATSGTKGAWLGRRRLMAIDATSFDVADTEANLERFGRMGSGPKASAYPKLHVAALAECGSHAIVGAVLDGCRTGERTLAAGLSGAVGPGMLVMADAGLYSYELFTAFAATGADLAWRIGASVSVGHLRWLPDGSYHALIYTPGLSAVRRARLADQARAGHQIPAEVARLVRVVEYTVPDRNPDGDLIAVITTVTDVWGFGRYLTKRRRDMLDGRWAGRDCRGACGGRSVLACGASVPGCAGGVVGRVGDIGGGQVRCVAAERLCVGRAVPR